MSSLLKLVSLKKRFQSIVETEIANTIIGAENSELPMPILPAAIRNYLEYCGYKKNYGFNYCITNWKSAHLKLNPKSKWTRIDCNQVNFIKNPARIVYLRAMLFGLIPIEAIHKFQKGKGKMLVKLLKVFTITNAEGPKMDSAELVTILAEAMLIPEYFFQPYISWTELDPFTIKGTIRNGSLEASGIFYFNEYCELLRFETNDRYYTHNSILERYKWTAYAWNYKVCQDIKYPSNFMATWSLPIGDYTYFKGRLDGVTYF
jgi:hypothetical protein